VDSSSVLFYNCYHGGNALVFVLVSVLCFGQAGKGHCLYAWLCLCLRVTWQVESFCEFVELCISVCFQRFWIKH